jgi:hypothetical protein
MTRIRKKKECIQCGELKDYRECFYKISRYRRSARCKSCISENNKRKRWGEPISERKCRKCGEVKPRSEFKSDHMSSHCLSCGSIRRKKEEVTEARCIVCGEIKSRDSFRSIYRSGSKCISCVDARVKRKKIEY